MAAHHFNDLEKVRAFNSDTFVNDFNRINFIVILCALSNCYLRTSKRDLWETAKYTSISYRMTSEVIKGHEAMIIY